MALNIPNVGSNLEALLQGINTGGGLYSRLMQPILEREAKEQQQRQFDEQMKLRRAAAGRAAANAELQQQILRQKLDPNYEINQLKNAVEAFQGQSGQNQMPAPQELIGEGMGAFNPEGLVEAQNVSGPKNTALDMEAIRKNPILRGFLKKKFGFDVGGGQGGVYHGAARDAMDLERLRQDVGEDSPVYQNAKSAYESTINARKDLRDLRSRTKAGLKSGEKEFFDEQTGEPLGKEIPLTAKERESEEGNILFNELYPYVYKGASPFSGLGSIRRLEEAASRYKTDSQARKLFDDFLLSEKMLAATTVNEASTLKSGHTNQTYNRLKESLDAQDVPKKIKSIIKQYQIPSSAQLKAAMRYQELLSNARKKARTHTPATQRLFYNPERQAEFEAKKNPDLTPESNIIETKTINGIKYEKINGEWYESE